jgi:hypothetical protein
VALVRERTIPTERPPPVGEVSANFLRIEGCHVVSATVPHDRFKLCFLDRSRYFLCRQLLNSHHEAEWIPFRMQQLRFYSLQWLYSICFGRQKHPKSEVHMLNKTTNKQTHLDKEKKKKKRNCCILLDLINMQPRHIQS